MHDQANIYLVMEYCSGQRLSHIFKINSKFKEEDLAPIIKGVCKGLLELHSHNVIYRSLKADNVMLSFGVPKLTNFGQSVFNPNQYR
jgi:serine/threonine protein kinase